ncbi:M14 family metallopeptidase [Thalassotalea sp. 1_MG-2023]|uniref:M14 family metallopeptidase n=1 Tax=Thalassotalea sp. 1_MG-2023 TaxID=3062680 RepID=UPI0026E420F7|nr:M14 family metallopeptidase [Thalassotalea sp. 1_MG-2023]MDO6428679.1 M14 family metallopeptidase [Thalassotalea sp. 1_MG-2023]
MIRIAFTLLLLFFTVSTFACDLGDIKIHTDFSGATSKELIASCSTNKSNDRITIELQPENTPINNSPWYAFKLSSAIEKNITIELKVKDGSHRYSPKLSYNGKQWQPIAYKKTPERLRMNVTISKQPIWISAQELITNDDYIHWGKALEKKAHITHSIIGHSVNEHPLYKIESSSANIKKWLIVLGRQHPPEITGALALFPFSTNLLSNSELARVFRAHYNILIIPNMNPDGVSLGYWRHNANGVDLNRDWKNFKQPEVSVVHKILSQIVDRGEEISMAVDFHSTHKDIFYTMPTDYGIRQPYLVSNWLNALDKKHPNFNVIQKPGNNPNKGVFKQYIADMYNVHAITYEMGDHTDRKFIRKLAIDASNTLMQTMLKDNKHEN